MFFWIVELFGDFIRFLRSEKGKELASAVRNNDVLGSPPLSEGSSPAKNKNDDPVRMIFFVILFAPAPFFLCFDGCLGAQFILPLIISWLPVLTVFSLFSPSRFLWHILFILLFAFVYVPVARLIDGRSDWATAKKRIYKVFLFLCYWVVITFLWTKIPLEMRQVWLGQHP